jgi:hypothetical protein
MSRKANASKSHVLPGRDNFAQWDREFRAEAQSKGLLAFFLGNEVVPHPPEEPAPPELATYSKVMTREEHNILEIAFNTYSSQILLYNIRLNKYEKAIQRAREASKLLFNSINPTLRSLISFDAKNPKSSYEEVKLFCAVKPE